MGSSHTLRTAGASFLALVSLAASAADRCTVSWIDAAVPSGTATFIVAGPQAAASPRVVLTTVHTSASSMQGRVLAPSPAPGSEPRSTTLAPAPRPPQPQPKNDQERLVAAIFAGDVAGVQRLVHSSNVDVNAAQSCSAADRNRLILALTRDSRRI